MRAALAVLIIAQSLLVQVGPAPADEPTAVGLWEQSNSSTGRPDAWFLVSEHDGRYSATLVKIFARSGADLHPRCTKCVGDQKNAPWLGLTVVKGMERDGLGYENGTILDPRDGSQYYARMRLSPDGRTLTVRSYLGIDPLGGNEAWHRLPDTARKELYPSVIGGRTARRS